MEYLTFVSVVAENLNRLLDQTATTSIQTTLKNNGRERVGITIAHEATNIFPTIYLEEFFEQYQSGRNIEDIVSNIAHIYHEVKFETDWDVSQITDFSHAKNNVVYKLIHFERNKELLCNVPFIPYHDLAIVFYLLLEKTERGTASILITNDIQNSWHICLSDLYQAASQNTPNLLVPELKPICAVIQDLLNTPCQHFEDHESHMYVLSNHMRHFGAACILYNHVLEDIGNQLGEDFYVLPSSVHETILIPLKFSSEKVILDQMVKEVNETQLSEEEVLSDHAYYYSRKDRKLLMNP